MFFQSKKIGLVSSFLLAVCPFAFTSMRAEMDAIVVFFLLANLYLLYRGVNENSKLLIHLSFYILVISYKYIHIYVITIIKYPCRLASVYARVYNNQRSFFNIV